MYVSAILLSMFAAISLLSSNSVLNSWYKEQDAKRERVEIIEFIGAGVQSFFNKEKRYPDDLTELINHADFSFLSYIPVERVFYEKTTISDNTNDITYEKFIIAVSKGVPLDWASYLSASFNACGTGGFSTSVEFCGSPTANWLVGDTRELYKSWSKSQNQLFDTLAVYFYEKSSFPVEKHDGTIISDGTTNTMKSIVAFNQSSELCSGIFEFDGVTVGCEALFNVAGGDIFYQVNNNKDVILYAEMPFKKADNTTSHYIVKEFKK